jgi:hypothetical protein
LSIAIALALEVEVSTSCTATNGAENEDYENDDSSQGILFGSA